MSEIRKIMMFEGDGETGWRPNSSASENSDPEEDSQQRRKPLCPCKHLSVGCIYRCCGG